MKLIYSIFFLLTLNSCFVLNHKFKITHEKIKSNHFFYQGFTFSEIKVDSLDSKNIPVKFKKVKSAVLYVKDSKGLKPKKTIYFYKPVTGYFWRCENEMGLPILPIKTEKNKWYLIDGLVFWGTPNLSKFIYINERGKCISYTKPIITNW